MKLYNLFIVFLLLSIYSCSSLKTSTHDFKSIFDGKTLTGWEGNPTYWRVENGVLIGEITPETILKQNSFLIYKNAQPGNFELKVDYRISSKGNSGVNYRSSLVDSIPFALKGYQADLDGKDKYNLGYPRHTGQNYEERGRQFLATRGQIAVIETRKEPTIIDSTGTKAALLKAINFEGWNHLHIIAKGNHLQHYINGVLMSDVTDNDLINRKMQGFIGVQVHVGPPMKIEYKDFLLKILD